MGRPATIIQGLCKRDGVQGQGEGAQAVLVSDSRITAADNHAKRDFGSSKGIRCSMNLAGVVRTREGQKSQNLVMTGEGGEGMELSWYSGTKTRDTHVGR